MEGVPGQAEPNLALIRKESVDKHNALLKDFEELPDDKRALQKDTQSWENKFADSDAQNNFNERDQLRGQVKKIDNYRKLVTPEDFSKKDIFTVEDIDTPASLNKKKTDLTKQIAAYGQEIAQVNTQIQKLRAELGMPEELKDDIPSLTALRQKQTEMKGMLENINSAIEKGQKNHNPEMEKIEMAGVENFTDSASLFYKKMQMRLGDKNASQIFSEQSARLFGNGISAMKEAQTVEQFSNSLKLMNTALEDALNSTNWGTNDNTDEMRQFGRGAGNMVGSLEESANAFLREKLTKEDIAGEEAKRSDLLKAIGPVKDNLNKFASMLAQKAQALDAYRNVR